jgi:hypothetical protein
MTFKCKNITGNEQGRNFMYGEIWEYPFSDPEEDE